jgi:hypothetical protein
MDLQIGLEATGPSPRPGTGRPVLILTSITADSRTGDDRKNRRTGRPQKSMESEQKLHDSIPNFAQMITTELESYPERIIAQFQTKPRETQIEAKNENFFPKTKIYQFL